MTITGSVTNDAATSFEILLDGTVLGQVTPAAGASSFSQAFSVGPGSHSLVISALDGSGYQVKSSTVSFKALAFVPASVSVASPIAGSLTGAQITVAATYSGSIGLNHFEVWMNGVKLGNVVPSANSFSQAYTMNRGNHSLTVIAVDTQGNSIKSAIDAFSSDTAPIVSLSANVTSGIAPLSVSVSTAGSAASVGASIASIQIACGNGTLISAASGTCVYASGAFMIKATVTDNLGVSASKTLAVSATAPANIPGSVAISSPASGSVAGAQITVAASYKGSIALNHFEVWGDGVKLGNVVSSGNSFSQAYPINRGNHALQVVAVDTQGNVIKSPVDNFFSDTAPTVSLSTNVASGIAPLSVSVNTSGSAASSGASIASTSINCGNGAVLSASSGSCTFSSSGSFTITAKVTDNFGLSSSKSATILVSAAVAKVTIQSPASGASVGSPVVIQASYSGSIAVNHFEVWVDGTKLGNVVPAAGSVSIKQSYSMTAGQHKLTVVVNDTSGNVIKSPIDTFTVE
jgi:PKD repeat protein